MKVKKAISRLSLLVGAALLVFSGVASAQAPKAAGNVTFTVTAVGKGDATPVVNKDNVELYFGKERKQVGEIKKPEQLFLAILIDDSLDSSAGGQWDYLRSFIMSQAPTTYVLVGYMANNVTTVAQEFTTDHALAAKAIRLPMGLGGIGSSPYLSASDLLQRWPATGPQRSILMITSGLDFFAGWGGWGGWGTFDSYLEPLVTRAQKQNTNIWSVYYPSAGHWNRSFWRISNAQMNIDRMSQETGGEAFYLGTGYPVSLQPYFNELNGHLANQYLITTTGDGGSKGKLENEKVKSTVPDVEFLAPSQIFVPPAA